MANERKVGFYGRVSTEHEAQINALENQMLWYEARLKEHPEWILVDYYIDEGVTGTQAKKRDGFMRMINDARNGKINLIVTREISRFARNTLDAISFTRYLKSINVEVYFVSDNIWTFEKDAEMKLSLLATFAQDESRKTSERVTAGQKISRQKGVVYGNGNILGYDRVDGNLVINPEQAETVRMIFQMYLDGIGNKGISDELERRGRLTSSGTTNWHSGTVNHILKNSTYCGILEYGKEHTPDFLSHERKVTHDDSMKFQVRGDYEPIISEHDFLKAQEMMEKKRATTAARNLGKKPMSTVWGNLLICSCGHKFCKYDYKHDGNLNRLFGCYSQKNFGSVESRKKRGLSAERACTTQMIPEWKLQLMAKLIFSEQISGIEESLAIAKTLLEKHINDTDNSETVKRDIENKMRLIESKRKYIDGLIDMCASGLLDKGTYISKRNTADSEIERLETEISDLERSIGVERVDYDKRLEDLKNALESYVDFSKSAISENVIAGLTDKIVVDHNRFDWYLYPSSKDDVFIGPLSPEEEFKKSIQDELDGKRAFMKVAEFTITQEEAKKYLYSISTHKRVYNWIDPIVSIWI